MKLKALTVVMVVLVGASLAAQDRAREQKLQQAIDLLESKGDVVRATPLLEDVAKSSDKALAARALLYLGQAQERRGKEQARRTYERIVREFASQQQIVAQARARIAALGTSAAPVTANGGLLTNRHVWTAPETYSYEGRVSHDGRIATLLDWPRGGFTYDIYVQDLRTLTTRKIVGGSAGPDGRMEQPETPILSSDGRRLAYSWTIYSGQRPIQTQVRIADLESPGATPRVLFISQQLDSISPRDWSLSGDLIAVDYVDREGARRIGTVSIKDGSLRTLRAVASRRPTRMSFSPDGRFLAFNVPVASADDRDITVIELANGTETLAVNYPGDDTLIGWEPSGQSILFSSLRSGTRGLWSVPFGPSVGAARLLKGELNRIVDWLGITRTGAAYYAPALGGSDVKTAQFDFSTGEFRSKPADVAVDAIGATNAPRWSPDGKSLAYLVNRPGQRLIAIRSVATGKTMTQEFPINLRNGNPQLWQWSKDGSAFYAVGTDKSGRDGLFRFAVDGTLTLVAPKAPPSVSLPIEVDADTIRYHTGNSQGPIIEKNLRTGIEKTIFSKPGSCNYGGGSRVFCLQNDTIVEHTLETGAERKLKEGVFRYWAVSPDQRVLLTSTVAADAKSRVVELLDLASGASRELLRVGAEEGVFLRAWVPDGKSVVISTSFRTGAAGTTWWVPVSGGSPRKLEGLQGLDGTLQISPDGKTMAFGISDAGDTELWVLENFLPKGK